MGIRHPTFGRDRRTPCSLILKGRINSYPLTDLFSKHKLYSGPLFIYFCNTFYFLTTMAALVFLALISKALEILFHTYVFF